LLFLGKISINTEFFNLLDDLIIAIALPFRRSIIFVEGKSFNLVKEEFSNLILSEGAMQVIQIGMLFEILLADVIENMINTVTLDVPLQDADERLAPLAVDHHHADHRVYYLIQKLVTAVGLFLALAAHGLDLLVKVTNQTLPNRRQEVLDGRTVLR